MHGFYSTLKLISVSTLLFLSVKAMAIDTEYSGFARIIAGLHDDDSVRYNSYKDEISLEQDSLLGLQAQVTITDTLSATALGIARSNTEVGSDVEWLYLRYTPIKALIIKAGQMQTPFYNKSDVLDVGYAYPWLVAPTELYNSFVFKRFQGVDVRYSFNVADANINIEAYYGEFDDDLVANGSKVPTKVDNLNGYIGEVRFGSWQFRASYHTGDAQVSPISELSGLAQSLSLSGFSSSADSLGTDTTGDFYQMGLSYDTSTHFVLAEAAHIHTSAKFFPSISSYYLTYGYYFKDMTVLLTYAKREDKLSKAVNEIPLGINGDLDALAAGYQGAYAARSEDDLTSWTLGLRWDLYRNTALKAEVKNISSDKSNTTSFQTETGKLFDKELNILMMGVEWVF